MINIMKVSMFFLITVLIATHFSNSIIYEAVATDNHQSEEELVSSQSIDIPADEKVQNKKVLRSSLIQKLTSPNSRTRILAASTLVRMEQSELKLHDTARLVMPVFLDALLKGNSNAQHTAISVARRGVSFHVIDFIEDSGPKPTFRAEGIIALCRIMSTIPYSNKFVEPELPDLINDKNSTVREAAVLLSASCDPVVALSACLASANDEAACVRRASVHTSGWQCVINSDLKNKFSPIILRGLFDKNEIVRRAAAFWVSPRQILGVRLKADSDTLLELRNSFRQSSLETQILFLDVFETMGKDAEPALPELIQILNQTENEKFVQPLMLERVALILGQFGSDAKPAILTLRNALNHKVESVKIAAAIALVKIQPDEYRSHYSLLFGAVSGKNKSNIGSEIRMKALDVLINHAPNSGAAFRVLHNVSLGDSEDIRVAALRHLGDLYRRERRSKEILQISLGSENKLVRVAAARELLLIKQKEKRAVETLISVIKDSHVTSEEHFQALEALTIVSQKYAQHALPVFISVLQNKDQLYLTKILVLNTIKKLGPDAITTLPSLIRIIESEDTSPTNVIPRIAIDTIGNMGPKARVVIPALVRKLSVGSLSERIGAAETIEKLYNSK